MLSEMVKKQQQKTPAKRSSEKLNWDLTSVSCYTVSAYPNLDFPEVSHYYEYFRNAYS